MINIEFNIMFPFTFAWILTVYFCTSSAAVQSTSYPAYEPKYKYPLIRNKQFDFPTYIPVALLSSSANPVRLPPLRIYLNESSTLRVVNGGRVVFKPDKTEVATLAGGPVFGDEYVFYDMFCESDGVPNNTRVADTQNGVGYPGQFVIDFYNKLYKSFDNALNYRNGLLRIVIPLIVEGNEDNPSFTPVQEVIYKVRKYNSTASINVREAFHWLLKTFKNDRPYYVYPGAYINPQGKSVFCSITVRPSFGAYAWISYSQFTTFGKVENEFGQPALSTRAVRPLGQRPFIEAISSPVHVKYY